MILARSDNLLIVNFSIQEHICFSIYSNLLLIFVSTVFLVFLTKKSVTFLLGLFLDTTRLSGGSVLLCMYSIHVVS